MRRKTPVIHLPTMRVNKDCLHPTIEVANQYPTLHYDPLKIKTFFETVFSVHRHGLFGELSVGVYG